MLTALLLLAGVQPAFSQNGPPYPRLANVYLQGAIRDADIPALARWDVLVLSTAWSDAQLARLRALHPAIRIYFYICPYCVNVPPNPASPWDVENFRYAQTHDLWWYDRHGDIAADWPATRMINMTHGTEDPARGIVPWTEYLPARVEELVESHPMLDGIFYDNFWRGISWEQEKLQLDSDCNPRHNPSGCDGRADTPAHLDSLWNTALRRLARDTRARFDRLGSWPAARPLAILGNGVSDYFELLNGTMYEHFPESGGEPDPGNPHGYRWNTVMFDFPSGYLVAPFRATPYRVQVLNAVWDGSFESPERTPEFERHKRFTLVSTLLGDGYYSLDPSRLGHGALWWEPEFDHDGRGKGYLGYPRGPAYRALQPTGRELVANGSFSNRDAGWQVSQGRFDIDTATFHSAPAAARIELGDGASKPGGGNPTLKLSRPGIAMQEQRGYTLSFWARAAEPRELVVQLYCPDCPGRRALDGRHVWVPSTWTRFDVSFVSRGGGQVGLDFFLETPGTVWIDDVSLREGDTSLFRRDFDRGTVLLNDTARSRSVSLGRSYRRLRVAGSPVFDGAAVSRETIPSFDARILVLDAPKN